MARYILLAVMLGAGDALMRHLRWERAGDGEPPHSWLDLETRELHRLGPDAPKLEAYCRVPVRIPRFLIWSLKRWRAHDLRLGLPYVLGVDREITHCFDTFRQIAGQAGVDATPKTLVDTFAANAMRRRGTSLFGLAIALGRETRRVKAKYRHFRPDFQAEAVEGTNARPASLDCEPPTSETGGTATPARKRRGVSGGRAA